MDGYDDFLLLEERIRFGGLFDAYSSLLSGRQRTACEMLMEGDLSVAELGEALGVTRQGAHDLLKRSRERLEEIESNLRLLELRERHQALVDAISDAQMQLPGGFVDILRDAGLLQVGKEDY